MNTFANRMKRLDLTRTRHRRNGSPSGKVTSSSAETPGIFPVEVWEKIIPELDDTPTLAALCRTSKTTNDLAQPLLYRVVRLNTRQSLLKWMSMADEDRTAAMEGTRHLEVHFDLRYLRDKQFNDVFLRNKKLKLKLNGKSQVKGKGKSKSQTWSLERAVDRYRPMKPGYNQLDTVHLTTSGFEWCKVDPDEGDSEAVVSRGWRAVTLSCCVNRLMYMLVGEDGPVSFRWTSTPRPISQSTSARTGGDDGPHPKTSSIPKAISKIPPATASAILFAHWKWINGVNRCLRSKAAPHPRPPSIIYHWCKLQHIELPWLMRPNWCATQNVHPEDRRRHLRVFSIDGGCLHKFTQSLGLRELLIEIAGASTTAPQASHPRDSEHGHRQKTILEIRGKVKSGRENCLLELYQQIATCDPNQVIRVARVPDRKANASQWRETLAVSKWLREEAEAAAGIKSIQRAYTYC
ncbi:hypothetical protein I316_01003 [Kwoniella heveanensis BCC8398]|uniref:F-box domain-containing protein n=1 Tax=Kwoniella heveanensis BCC8398 TaxID=1296120 RepID=A0A1B9H1D8_9TREE|nr:hypothetical protein I316_01003 [Kwoniella heveanensis BCC8398]